MRQAVRSNQPTAQGGNTHLSMISFGPAVLQLEELRGLARLDQTAGVSHKKSVGRECVEKDW